MSLIKSVRIVVAWALLGVTVSAPSSSLDPAPGRSPGPPQWHPSTPPQDSDEQLDLNLSGYSHELNHINSLAKSSSSGSAATTVTATISEVAPKVNEKLTKVETTSNENADGDLCANDGNVARKYVHDGETVVAANVVRRNGINGDDGPASSTLTFDVIHDVFETSNEPLVPDIMYTGE